MEGYLGRKLDDNEDVHHKDGNFNNNYIDNLELKHFVEHGRQHRYKPNAFERIILEFECPQCQKKFKLKASQFRQNQLYKNRAGPFCSRSCASKRNQRV